MTASEVGAVPDDVQRAVAEAFLNGLGAGRSYLDCASAALSVPSVAEVFARDAKVRELVAETKLCMAGIESSISRDNWRCSGFKVIAALYSEDGTR